MNIITLTLTAIGLAMDAFAVSIILGMQSSNENKFKVALKAAIYFGVFQGAMPVIGWFLGVNFSEYIEKYDHWIAFIVLGVIGSKMIIEAIKNEEVKLECPREGCFTNKRFLMLAIATSIDALAVGVSFAFLKVNIIYGGLVIALITAIFSFLAVYAGKIFGTILKRKAEVLGGVVLVIIAFKILLEHLSFLHI